MTKKRKNMPTIEEILERPWCYYCERDFDDNRILVSHQKAKHYKCDKCHRRLNTAGGLSVHMQQVHKEQLTQIENAIPGREDINIEIFGMVGIPEDLFNAHKQSVTNNWYKLDAERRAATGNPAPGTKGDGEPAAKRVKEENPADLKARLAEHRRKKEEERRLKAEANNTPPANPAPSQSVPGFQPTPSPGMAPTPPMPYGVSPFQQSEQAFAGSPLMPGYPPPAGAPGPFNGVGGPMHTEGGPMGRAPTWHAPPAIANPQQQMQHNNGHRPRQPPAPNVHQARTGNNGDPPATAIGLPARPNFNPPQMSREDMQRMHSGHAPPPGAAPGYPRHPVHHHMPGPNDASVDDGGVSGLIESVRNELSEKDRAAKQQANADANANATPANAMDTGRAAAPVMEQHATANETIAPAVPSPATPAPAGKKEKKPKKTKDAQKMVYPEQALSPEEKMAQRSKYSYKREDATQFTTGAPDGAVSGVAMDQDTVLDAMADH